MACCHDCMGTRLYKYATSPSQHTARNGSAWHPSSTRGIGTQVDQLPCGADQLGFRSRSGRQQGAGVDWFCRSWKALSVLHSPHESLATYPRYLNARLHSGGRRSDGAPSPTHCVWSNGSGTRYCRGSGRSSCIRGSIAYCDTCAPIWASSMTSHCRSWRASRVYRHRALCTYLPIRQASPCDTTFSGYDCSGRAPP